MLAIDTETTGIDIRHGCRPFYVSMCNGPDTWGWEWEVSPKTRVPRVKDKDLDEIREVILAHCPPSDLGLPRVPKTHRPGKPWRGQPPATRPATRPSGLHPSSSSLVDTCHGWPQAWEAVEDPEAPGLVFHNAKFDLLVLESIGVDIPSLVGWERIHDTHIAHHVLASQGPHGLKELASLYLDVPLTDELDLLDAVEKARGHARKRNYSLKKKGQDPLYAIADKTGHPHFPAQTSAPKAGWKVMDYWLPRCVAIQEPDHPMAEKWSRVLGEYALLDAERTWSLWQLFAQDLGPFKEQYLIRRDLLEVYYDMEARGVTLSEKTTKKAKVTFSRELKKAEGYLNKHGLKNPRSPRQVKRWFDEWGCPLPNTEKKTLEDLRDQEEEFHDDAVNLLNFRGFGKALEYTEGYENHSHQVYRVRDGKRFKVIGWWRVHPTFNICGTGETRSSSQNPNAQNISKQSASNLRSLYGPLSDRAWVAIDYENVEMRIFAEASQEPEVLDCYARGDSFHSLVCQLLYPDLWAECERKGEKFKVKYKDTLYQWVKNGNFSLIYGAGIERADRTYHYPGAFKLIRKKFRKIDSFMKQKNDEALKYGFITTMGGYQLEVPDDAPHKAVNYFVQGTAGWIMCKAMVACHKWLAHDPDSHIIMQVHDELVFDLPRETALSMVPGLCQLMEEPGTEIGIKTPVEPTLILDNWSKGEDVVLAHAA